MRLVARIREIAKEKGIPLDDLALRSEVSERYLWHVLAGKSSPTLEWVAKVAAGLGVDPHRLIRPHRKPRVEPT